MAILDLPFKGQFNIYQGWGNTGVTAESPNHNYKHWHNGWDYSPMLSGTQLYAMADGKVIHASLDDLTNDPNYGGAYGLELVLKYDCGFYSLYGHQSSIEVAVGQRVVRGQPVSHSGGGGPRGTGTISGNSSGAHLHMEVRRWPGGYSDDVNPASVVGDYTAQTGATPPSGGGAVVPTLPGTGQGAAAAGSGSFASGGTGLDGTGLTPQESLETILGRIADNGIRLRAVRRSDRLPGTGDGTACALLWVSTDTRGGGMAVPLLSATAHLTALRAPGSLDFVLSTDALRQRGSSAAVRALSRQPRTQVILYGGYAADPGRATVDDLDALFTGLIQGGTTEDAMTLQMTGHATDLSGLLSTPSETADQLGSFAGLGAADLARKIGAAVGLAVDAGAQTATVGTYTDPSLLTQTQQGQTLWNVLTKAAEAEGWACYVDGTTLVMRPLSSPGTPYVLRYHAADGRSDERFDACQLRTQAHANREYRVVVQSYDSTGKAVAKGNAQTGAYQPATGAAGSKTTNQEITVTEGADQSPSYLDKRAAAILAEYQRAERVLKLGYLGLIPLLRMQPLRLLSTRLSDDNEGRPYYPTSVTYAWAAEGQTPGWHMDLLCTSREWGVQTVDSGSSLGF